MENLNATQLKILSTLLFNPKARFKDMNKKSMSTDNFSYHVRSLIALGLIKKDSQNYSLTSNGKIVAGKIDTTVHKIEKQPKPSVFLIAHKTIDGVEKYLIQQRTKEPFFGYWGFITGKIRYGETLAETAARELKEEAGLEGISNFRYEIHEMVYDKNTNDQLEDKFFHILEVKDLSGKLLPSTKEGKNKFVTAEEFRQISPKFHNEQDLFDWFLKNDFSFKEEKYYIDEF